ncbi:MAG: DUF3298 domain-containing protein [Lachnospiraceae bacterium]|nr:DUF3298 domain-containing protein [Lachnospiraceae bacterium]
MVQKNYKREWFEKVKKGSILKSILTAMILFTIVIISGCGALEPTSRELQGDVQTENVQAGGEQENKLPLFQGTSRSSILQEDEEYLYLCGSCRVAKINKTTGEEQVIWENTAAVIEKEEYIYASGSGLLLGDKLYFIESSYCAERWENARWLSVINVDGSGYEQITELNYSYIDDMLLLDGILYIANNDKEIGYRVKEDGSLEMEPCYEKEVIGQLSYEKEGTRVLFQQEALQEFGYYLTRDGQSGMAGKNKDTGKQEILIDYDGLQSYNGSYFLCKDFSENSLKLLEQNTLKERVLYESEESYRVYGMDEEYAYIIRYAEEAEDTNYSFDRIALETGEREVLFSRSLSQMPPYNSHFLMNWVVKDDFLYYVMDKDNNYYLMQKDLNTPKEEAVILGNVIYETGIGEIGTVNSFQDEKYSVSNPQYKLYCVGLSWLQVNEDYAGAAAINEYLAEYRKELISCAEDFLKENEEWMEADIEKYGVYGMHYETISCFDKLDYFDSHYISFVQEEYRYSGGAHGMPAWVGMTFDLQSGRRLLLSDIINNSEEELKEIVTGYFAEWINKCPENFWDNAVETVRESVSYKSDYYLTKGGIVFYYAPYEIACYSAGFQYLTIPYDEFDMKITLKKAVDLLREKEETKIAVTPEGMKPVHTTKGSQEATEIISATENNAEMYEELPTDGEGWGLSFKEE